MQKGVAIASPRLEARIAVHKIAWDYLDFLMSGDLALEVFLTRNGLDISSNPSA